MNAVKSYQTIYTAAASGSDYQITPSPIWEQVASVEAVDGDTRHVKVTMSKPWYPIEAASLPSCTRHSSSPSSSTTA